MRVIGLDGFRKGWVAVALDGDARAICFPKDIDWLGAQTFHRAAIDMPIGLSESGLRDCDLQARDRLRPHASRVFTGARRMLYDHADHAGANRALSARGESKISIQLWGLVPKIREIDGFVRADRHLDLREAHPELVFLRLNRGAPLPSKHTDEGVARRRDLLMRQGFVELDDWLGAQRRGTGAKIDDVLDACAVAIAARDFDQGICLPPGDPPRDAEGLPMQIWG